MISCSYESFYILHNGIPRHLWGNSTRQRVENEAMEQMSITSKVRREIKVVKIVPRSLAGL